jgi:iron complex outermembrane receptor protein
LLYGSYGLGFRSGGFNNSGSAATVDTFINGVITSLPGGERITIADDFEKEVSHSVELGFRATLGGGRVTLDGSVYRTWVNDMQFAEFIVGNFGLLRVVSNIDEVTITGGELGFNARVTDRWSVDGGFSIVDSRIDKNSSRPLTEGNESPYSPRYTATFGSTYIIPITSTVDFVGRLDYSLVGPTWFHTVQDETVQNLFNLPMSFKPSRRDSFELLNLRAGVESDTWSATVFVRNLMDEEYLEEVLSAPEFGGSFVHPGARRAWGVEVTYRF